MKDCPRFKVLATFLLILTALMFLIGAPQAASGPDAFRFVVFADSRGNWTPGQEINTAALNYLNNQIVNLNPKPDLVFFLGDMVTMAYDANQKRLLPDWKKLMTDAGFSFAGLEPGKIPLYVAIGNHELYDYQGNYLASLEGEYQYFFSEMPGNGPAAYNKLAYSVGFGNSLFIVLDTFGFMDGNRNWDNGIDELQYWWFYATALQSQAKHKFVLTHGPAYSTEGWPVGNLPVRDLLWQAMKALHFDLYLCGHEHLFARWRPDGSLTQIISGSAGATPDDKIKNPLIKSKYPIFAAWDYIFTVVDVQGDFVTAQTYAARPQPSPTYTVKVDPLVPEGSYLMLFEP
ncbi:MAG: metallophosphoesterase [Deltaproteobacteria bacterium]|nr:metallophosphoesterase [Deltaproteobacteria bacterium]